MTLETPAESFRALDRARAVIAGEVYSVCTPYSVLVLSPLLVGHSTRVNECNITFTLYPHSLPQLYPS